mmetsp:Transcript_3796/g.8226  ORF Transcript_3796/g.8226 Transcript_3796/m.8226 type:complete len:84 (-) Transcript_3796:37-288(-)
MPPDRRSVSDTGCWEINIHTQSGTSNNWQPFNAALSGIECAQRHFSSRIHANRYRFFCKTSAGVDWTYTMTQQLDTKQQVPLL